MENVADSHRALCPRYAAEVVRAGLSDLLLEPAARAA